MECRSRTNVAAMSREKKENLKKKNNLVEIKRSMVQKKKERKEEITPKPEFYYKPTPSTSIPPRVARLCRIVNLERSLKNSLVLYNQKTTDEAPAKKCMCEICIKRSALHKKKVPFMLNSEYFSNEEGRFKPNYIEYMEAEENENQDRRSKRSRSSQVVDTSNSVPQDFLIAGANSPNSGSSFWEEKQKRSERKHKNGKEKKRKDETEIENQDRRSKRSSFLEDRFCNVWHKHARCGGKHDRFPRG